MPTSQPAFFASEFPKYGEARAIHIRKQQTFGISTRPYVEESYSLAHDTEQFVGQVRFVVGRNLNNPREAVEDITVPLDAVQAFLHVLANAPLEPGEHTPMFATDGCRFTIQIELELEKETVVFLLDSPDDFDSLPWKVRSDQKAYLVYSNIPLRALGSLKPHLRQDVLQEIIGPGDPIAPTD